MNYWLTTHWPPITSDAKRLPDGVYLPDDRGIAGKDLKAEDKVLFYQSLSGRSEIKKDASGKRIRFHRIKGKQGIIAIAETLEDILETPSKKEQEYSDGTKIKWSWSSKTKILNSKGFVSRKKVNKILGYSSNYSLRGFGDYKSGLKKLTKQEFDLLVKEFLDNSKDEKRKYDLVNLGGGESAEHLELKNFVGNFPEKALNETGVILYEIEYNYPTGDRCDVVLKDECGAYITVEIELSQTIDRYEGMLQAIKYKYMLAVMQKVRFEEVRAMLIAYEISSELKKLCKEYNVECIEIKREIVVKNLTP